ncbi:MAG: hypothetical protein LBS21_13545 [Clostridiales bacterium]|jgi:hypothetical protein|nr:hypothetical protein [Clostridiales bacterium]
MGDEEIMHSICCVVLPDNLNLSEDSVYSFLRSQIGKYDKKIEVEPYKKFFTYEETLFAAKNHGFNNMSELEDYYSKEHLNNSKLDEGIENGLFYWISTYNMQGRWDYFNELEIKKVCDLESDFASFSVVTLDGVWHSETDYGYKPILDFELGKQHPDNVEPCKKWLEFWDSFTNENKDKNIVVMNVHS